MPALLIHCWLLLCVVALSWAVIYDNNFDRLSVKSVDMYSKNNCLRVPYMTYICHQCFHAGLVLSVTSCCQDLTIIHTCNECLMNSFQQSADSKLQALIMNSDFTTDKEKEFISRQERRGLVAKMHSQSPFSANYHTRSRKPSQESNIQKDPEVNKKWYSPYKYILSLFPQRLSYGHSIFLQGLMAQRSKSNKKAKAAIAWMKRSGNYNNDFAQNSLNTLFEHVLTDIEIVNGQLDSTNDLHRNYAVTDDFRASEELSEDNNKVWRQRKYGYRLL